MSKDICQKFAIRLKEIRTSKKLTKSKLSELADVDISYIGKIERFERIPTLTIIAKLANALEISVKDLFDFEN